MKTYKQVFAGGRDRCYCLFDGVTQEGGRSEGCRQEELRKGIAGGQYLVWGEEQKPWPVAGASINRYGGRRGLCVVLSV